MLPCDSCQKFDNQTGYCRKVNEPLFNGYAKLYWSQKCGENQTDK
ncbi:MAG: hypothetical protein ACFCUE_13260 [Candidatus Bathyarchaeia archaeon]